mmetsp:Transcript_19097/g.34148  ORF Transcript_19097/g.34148 Transcript_19097/m.34148 type:complete len:128 (+) Transcript_19097:451-834(+)
MCTAGCANAAAGEGLDTGGSVFSADMISVIYAKIPTATAPLPPPLWLSHSHAHARKTRNKVIMPGIPGLGDRIPGVGGVRRGRGPPPPTALVVRGYRGKFAAQCKSEQSPAPAGFRSLFPQDSLGLQ